jgi:LacI family transcriptional regulator/LacI family purine nucleotide synthesis repressor
MSVTIIDVARAAGVSKTTVSAVICGKSGVKEETRQLVLDTINELHYVPNFNARNFVQKRTNILGALIMSADKRSTSYEFANETGVYAQDISRGIISRLSTTRYGLMTAYIYPGENVLPPMLADNRIDGMFAIGSIEMPSAVKQLLIERGIPVVAIGRTYNEFDSIRVDVPRAVCLATQYLIANGHRRIALVNCAPNYVSNSERLEGYRRALGEAGIDFDRSLVVDCRDNTGCSGYNAAQHLLTSDASPSALVAANVSITMGVLRYLYQNKIRVPDDISVIGHEDSVMYSYAAPALTAINIRKELTGSQAAELLLERLSGNNDGKPVCRYIEPMLTVRDSVRKY